MMSHGPLRAVAEETLSRLDMERSASRLRLPLAVIAMAAAAAVVIVAQGRGGLRAARTDALAQTWRGQWSPQMGTNTVFLPKAKESFKAELAAALAARPTALTAARFQELAAGPEDCCTPTHVPVEDVYEEYNLCSSCLQSCKLFHEEQCGFDVIKEQCLPNVLLEGCAECEGSGCGAVVAFLDENAELNASAPEGADNITRLEIFTELVWEHAREQAVKSLPTLKDCIDKASTVGLAEKCLAAFLHPMPATLAHEALSVAQEVGPPQCKTNYVGSKCLPTPDPEMHGGSCPQGFMCMPDPSRCSSCACSCNSPEDKLDTFEACMQRGKSAEAGSFCMAALFTQLPPAFVEQALHKASEPAGASEHYTQIFSACGGGENGTQIVSSCLEQVEYCVRPLQGHPGTFPDDFSKYQSLCDCFRKPEVLAECGPDEEVQASCASAIREHYVMHVHHQYCLHNTETACEFTCKWPLPGFFGEVAQAA